LLERLETPGAGLRLDAETGLLTPEASEVAAD
jgi:hypothetical protein